MDQTIEETINKDIQTGGSTEGFSTNKNAVAKYYITADDRANFARELRAMVDLKHQGFYHPDMTKPRIRRDKKGVQSLCKMMTHTRKNLFSFKWRGTLQYFYWCSTNS